MTVTFKVEITETFYVTAEDSLEFHRDLSLVHEDLDDWLESNPVYDRKVSFERVENDEI